MKRADEMGPMRGGFTTRGNGWALLAFLITGGILAPRAEGAPAHQLALQAAEDLGLDDDAGDVGLDDVEEEVEETGADLDVVEDAGEADEDGSGEDPDDAAGDGDDGGDDGQEPDGFDIEYYVELAQKNHPKIQAAKWKLKSYRKQLDEAHWAPYFNGISLDMMFTYMSRMEGDALQSPQGEFDISTDAGIWLRLEMEAGIPIYTFGKITSYWTMAEQGVKVGKLNLEKEKQQIAFDVRRAYLSLQIAREILAVTRNGSKYLKKALDRVEDDLDEGGGEFTESDLLKLKTGKVKLEVQQVQAKKIESISLAALRYLTGVPDLDPPDIPIEPEQTEVGELDQYLEAAQDNRPELGMLKAAVKVGKADVKLKKASMLPNFVLAGKYTFAYANKVEDQKTPFANDPFNKNGGGVLLLMQWPLDFVPGAFRLSKSKADLYMLQAQQETATGGIAVEVEMAYEDVIEAMDRMKVLKTGKKLGKGWIIAESQSLDAGLTKIKDFVDALTTYFEMYMLYYQAVYDFNVALARLRLVSGTDDIEAHGAMDVDMEGSE